MVNNNDPEFSFKFNNDNIDKDGFKIPYKVTKLSQLSNEEPADFFGSQTDSPKFGSGPKINVTTEIPVSKMDFVHMVENEIHKKTSPNKLSNNKIYLAGEEVEYGKKSHLEYLKLMRDNKDPLGVQLKGGLREISLEEVALHDKDNDLWTVLHGNVYDLTIYLDYHPGGAKQLRKGAGIDASDLFNEHHPWVNYNNLIGKLQIGFLKK